MFKKLTGFLGDSNEKEIKRLLQTVDKINDLEGDFSRLSDDDLKAKTAEFKKRLSGNQSLDDILPEAFAIAREAAKRTLGQRHYDVQLMGGMILHQGKIAEMKTGEGKTLVATLPTYLNALTGKGVHVVTVNDYLSKRDAHWMGAVYHALGMSVGCVQHDASFIFDPERDSGDESWPHLHPVPRREVYAADITYGTNNELGFDYLRDNMVTDLAQKVQRDFNYAIVDEVDNILIDEARTPLIISGQAEEATQTYQTFARLIPRLKEDIDYTIELKHKQALLTEAGIAKIENWLGVDNLYDSTNEHMVHYMENALRARVFFHRDHEYVVRDGEVVIVDEFTGRMMPGRRYSEGLHQAIEAKEGVKIQRESITLATITFQNFFRMYQKLAGMTGTAVTEAEEFHKIYKLEVVVIPTNKPLMRIEHNDQIYKNQEAKFRAVVREIKEYHDLGRPILVGTVAIETSEHLSSMLKKNGVPHVVLNAKEHEQEAYRVAQAGMSQAVTIATNMAGRGVDILLGGNPEHLARGQLHKEGINFADISISEWSDALKMLRESQDPTARYASPWAGILKQKWETCEQDKGKVLEAGGLHIIGTERHESRRIDNQLRGRAGRQGDPGSSRFFISIEDDIMRRFGGDRISGIMNRLGFDEDTPIEHSLINRAIGQTQVKVEGYHFDIRKRLLEYDDVLNIHRETIYGEREKILKGADLKANVQGMIESDISSIIYTHLANEFPEEWDLDAMLRELGAIFPLPKDLKKENLALLSRGEVEEHFLEHARRIYEEKEAETEPVKMRMLERLVMLRAIDTYWREHLTVLENIRQGIGLQAYAQKDPLVSYKKEAHGMFQQLQANIQRSIVYSIYHSQLVTSTPAPQKKAEAAEAMKKAGVAKKTGRNDPCPCGSGKKYKKCCGIGAS